MLLRGISFILTLAATTPAPMRDCPGTSIDGYKVILDNVNVLGPPTQDANLLLGRLRQKVQFELAAVQLEITPQMVWSRAATARRRTSPISIPPSARRFCFGARSIRKASRFTCAVMPGW